MSEYKKLYTKLFNALTDTIENLKQVQREAEEEYIKACENEPKIKYVRFDGE